MKHVIHHGADGKEGQVIGLADDYREAILALMALLDNAVAKERYLAMIEGKTERETCDEEQLDSPEMASARAVLKKMGAIK